MVVCLFNLILLFWMCLFEFGRMVVFICFVGISFIVENLNKIKIFILEGWDLKLFDVKNNVYFIDVNILYF